VKVTAAPGAKVVQMPSPAVVSGDAPAPNGPGVESVSLVMPPLPNETCVAGEPCMSFTLTVVMDTLPMLLTT